MSLFLGFVLTAVDGAVRGLSVDRNSEKEDEGSPSKSRAEMPVEKVDPGPELPEVLPGVEVDAPRIRKPL